MKILVAADDAVSRLKLEHLLTQWGYEVTAVPNSDEAWAVLQGPAPPPLAILDWIMPVGDGLELCRRVRQGWATAYVYVILLTARSGQENLIAGMEAGADEYLTKPYDPHELRLRVRAGQRIIELQEALRLQATHDPLTGAWNHGAIIEILQRDLNHARRKGQPVGVIMVDLDHFKQVNDLYGHLVGDEVLRLMARQMTGVLRAYDALGRYGGEEFLVIVPDCPTGDLLQLGERLRSQVASSPVVTSAGKVAITASLGITTSEGQESVDAVDLLRQADKALYLAKGQGRNCVVLAPRPEESLHENPHRG